MVPGSDAEMSVAALLEAKVGRMLVGVRRVQFVHRGTVQEFGGPLELTFDDGTAVVLDAGGDGESLALVPTKWVDPFQEPLSAENRDFVEQSGKWTAFDAKGREPWSRAIGNRVETIAGVRNSSDKLVGAQMQFGSVVVRVIVESDDLLVEGG